MPIWTPLVVRLRQALRVALSPATVNEVRYPSPEAFREVLFEAYGFTARAREVLRQVRLEIADLASPRGGGGWYGPEARRIVLNGVQAEAAIHEYAHAWADLTGIYTEHEPGGPWWPTQNREFRADVARATAEPDDRYARVRFLARQYEFGDPSIGFPGMGENDAERYAGLASGVMGDIHLMPPYLRRWYAGLFTGDVSADAPRP